MKFKYLILGLIGLASIAFAQQGPSIRLDGKLPVYTIPVGTGDRSVVESGVTISNGTMTVSNLVVKGSANLPGPLTTSEILLDGTNIVDTFVAKTDIATDLSGDETNKVPSVAAMNEVIFNRTEQTNTLFSGTNAVARFVTLTNGIALEVWQASTSSWIPQVEWVEY